MNNHIVLQGDGQGNSRHTKRESVTFAGGAAGVAPLSQLTTASFPTQSHLLFAQNFQIAGKRLGIQPQTNRPASKKRSGEPGSIAKDPKMARPTSVKTTTRNVLDSKVGKVVHNLDDLVSQDLNEFQQLIDGTENEVDLFENKQ